LSAAGSTAAAAAAAAAAAVKTTTTTAVYVADHLRIVPRRQSIRRCVWVPAGADSMGYKERCCAAGGGRSSSRSTNSACVQQRRTPTRALAGSLHDAAAPLLGGLYLASNHCVRMVSQAKTLVAQHGFVHWIVIQVK
jgi:hypothetical protein